MEKTWLRLYIESKKNKWKIEEEGIIHEVKCYSILEALRPIRKAKQGEKYGHSKQGTKKEQEFGLFPGWWSKESQLFPWSKREGVPW